MQLHFESFALLPGMPINVTALHLTAESARNAPRGDVELGFDPVHGLIRNIAFDEERLSYDEAYENSQFFSPAFRSFQDDLARRLIDRYRLSGADIIEIGSGKGEFLSQVCSMSGSRGYGFDPSYRGQSDDVSDGRVTFVVDSYDPKHLDQPADLICCRHVLEHLDDPGSLLTDLRQALDNRPDTVVYFEVPNAASLLSGVGMWDVIYQHVWYFAPPALRWLFEHHGFDILDLGTCFGESFLYLEGQPGAPREHERDEGIAELTSAVQRFGELLEVRRRWWSEWLTAARREGRRVALWGAGAKGVTFLNAVAGGEEVDLVVDVNPRKQGGFVPGTGQEIVGPDDIVARRVDSVLVMNRVYESEIGAMLAQRSNDAELVVVE